MMHGHEKSDSAIVAGKPTNKAERSLRSWWSQGRRPRGMWTSKARTGLSAGFACYTSWTTYGKQLPVGPEVGEAMGRVAEVVAPSSSTPTDGGCPAGPWSR